MKRHPILVVSLLAFSCVVGGCGVINMLLGGSSSETGSSKLLPFSSEAELASYLSGEIAARTSSNRTGDLMDFMGSDGVMADAPAGAPLPEGAPGGSDGAVGGQDTSGGFSGTTIQEVGVDEADVVKTDGRHLFLMDDNGSGNSLLRIVDIGAGVPMTVTSETELEGYGQQLYLYDGKVISLTSTGGGFFGGDVAIRPVTAEWDEAGVPMAMPMAMSGDDADMEDGGIVDEFPGASNDGVADVGRPLPGVDSSDFVAPQFDYRRPQTVVTVVDVSNPAAPVVLSETSFDGTQSSSRLIDGVLHLVVSNFESFYFDIFPAMGTPAFDTRVTDTTTMLPTYTRIDADGGETTGSVVTWEDMYRPTDPDGFGVVTVISLDIGHDAAFTSVGIAAEPGLVYSSTDALYLTDTAYDFSGVERETTDIYKFAYRDRGVVASATGSVPGRILNQYSMSEYNGVLRVASTLSARFGFVGPIRESSNAVYTLRENGSTLERVGFVDGIAPGERLQAARFIGDRGYLVTFEQIDPLFTLDLADATNPKVIGELEVPGFSTFIVPMDENHLLTVGRYIPPPGEVGPWGVQLSIFDVSNFAQPRRTSHVILGERTGASSEAIFNPKAFTYYAERGLVALPISIFEESLFFFEDDTFSGEVIAVDSVAGGGIEVADVPPPDTEPPVVDVLPPPDEPLPPGVPFVPGGFEGVVVFSATPEAGLSEVGRVSTRYPESNIYWSNYTRGVFIDNDVCAVTNRGVRRVPTDDIKSIVGELVFE